MENVGTMTDEKREKLRARWREQARRYLARETPEQREKRLAKGREYTRRRNAMSTPEEIAERKERARRLAATEARQAVAKQRRRDPAVKERRRERLREWSARPDRKRKHFDDSLKRNYGVTREEYDRIVLASCGKCDACGKQDTNDKKGLCLDHDHDTGLPRGMLCRMCNVALGNLNDSPLLIARLAAYASGIGRSA